MYGTRKEINQTLKRAFGNDEKLAVLVWSRESIIPVDESMTYNEVNHLLVRIGMLSLYEHTTCGISLNTLWTWLKEFRGQNGEEEATVPVDTVLLARVAQIAESALLSAKKAGDGSDPIQQGLEDVGRVQALLPAR